ncbi:MAG: type IV secretory pathway VirJ component [Verrucomicrobiales bacterium]|jgi:type IV secretory pathway VirJ component
MVLKDIFGKVRRFLSGRITALRENVACGIPESCLYRYPVESNLEATTEQGWIAVLYSGDGGWARLTTHLASRLQAVGIPVAGIDSMHYFWKEKNALEAAQELSLLLEKLSGEWQANRIVLLGYSMGADVLPAIARHLPDDQLRRVRRIVLMSPGHRVELKFRFVGWLGFLTPDDRGQPILSDVELLAETIPFSFFAGEKEDDSLVHAVSENLGRIKLLPGGHHYGSDYDALANEVISDIRGDDG